MRLHDNVGMSLSKGGFFDFDMDGTKINFKVSPVSGDEQVSINGEVVSSDRNYKLKSSHLFEVHKVPCRIELESLDPLKGNLECRLYRDDLFLSGYKLSYEKKKRSLLRKATPLVGGVMLGVLYSVDVFSLWIVVLVLLIGAVYTTKTTRHWSCKEIAAPSI